MRRSGHQYCAFPRMGPGRPSGSWTTSSGNLARSRAVLDSGGNGIGRSRPGGRSPTRPPSCHASSRRRARGVRVVETGRVDAVGHHLAQPAGAHLVEAVEVLGGQREPEVEGVVGVEDDGRELGVVGPGAAVEVVGAGAGPDVVDDADLRVHVDRGARVVLDAVRRHPAGGDPHQRLEGALPAEVLRHAVEPGDVGHQRDHHDQAEPGVVTQGGREDICDVVAPEVLVLDVDDALGAGHGLAVAARDAPLSPACERVVAAVSEVGIGAQQLDDVVSRLRWGRPLLRQRVG